MFKSKKNKLFIFFLLILFFLMGANFVLGAETLPDAPETLQEYIKYIYNLSLMIGGLLTFAILVYGGLRYLTSAGNPARMADAKDQIFAAILGLIILLSSYLILYTIDPHLVILKPPAIEEPKIVEPLPPVLPEERIHSYQEIPIGILISRVLEKEKLDEIIEVSKKAKTTSEELDKLTGELKTLTDQCACKNTNPNAATCDYHQEVCPATECFGDPCPNREAINAKIAEINSKIRELKGYIDEDGIHQLGLLAKVKESRNNLMERLNNLQVGEDYLLGLKWREGCAEAEIIDHDMMVWWEKERKGKTEIINLFPNFVPGLEKIPLTKRGVLNFYCRI